MNRPIPPILLVGVFLLIVIAAVLMLGHVISRQHAEQPRSTPDQAIALQLALLKEGNAVGLRLTCVEDLRAQITEDAVNKARSAWADVTKESLVGSVVEDEVEAGQARGVTVHTRSGVVLTHLVLVKGEWLATSLWFL